MLPKFRDENLNLWCSGDAQPSTARQRHARVSLHERWQPCWHGQPQARSGIQVRITEIFGLVMFCMFALQLERAVGFDGPNIAWTPTSLSRRSALNSKPDTCIQTPHAWGSKSQYPELNFRPEPAYNPYNSQSSVGGAPPDVYSSSRAPPADAYSSNNGVLSMSAHTVMSAPGNAGILLFPTKVWQILRGL
jgi:hypothetical protein